MISIIAVIGKNRELGKDNKLLWHIPGDLPRFKQLTSNHPVIMGKNTFHSIGRPLPNRTNIVVSKELPPQEGIRIARTLGEGLTIAQRSPGNEEIFVIGGGSIYTQAIESADRLYLTVVDATAEADTFFPQYHQFTKVVYTEHQKNDGYNYTYITLEK